MRTDSEIRQTGLEALVKALGPVEAERFIASISRDRFDYTEWRRNGLPVEDLSALSAKAEAFSRSLEGDA
jgi:hypothetical protein